MRRFIIHLKDRLRPMEEPYFARLADGTLPRAAFRASQAQFLYAVDAFSRVMLALAARCEDAELVAALHANVRDELGDGDPEQAHGATFRLLLGRLGAEEAPERGAVAAFNAALFGVALRGPVLRAVAALGIIEDLFAGFSAALADGIVARGWLPREEIVHYRVHEALDEQHAEDFYRFLDGPWARSAEERQAITCGLELGAGVFLQLYRGLLTEAELLPVLADGDPAMMRANAGGGRGQGPATHPSQPSDRAAPARPLAAVARGL